MGHIHSNHVKIEALFNNGCKDGGLVWDLCLTYLFNTIIFFKNHSRADVAARSHKIVAPKIGFVFKNRDGQSFFKFNGPRSILATWSKSS